MSSSNRMNPVDSVYNDITDLFVKKKIKNLKYIK